MIVVISIIPSSYHITVEVLLLLLLLNIGDIIGIFVYILYVYTVLLYLTLYKTYLSV